MLQKKFIPAFLALALFAASCKKTDNITPGGGGGNNPQPVQTAPITATLQGNVLDENGNAATGVTVRVGAMTGTTDSRGFFRFTGASLDKNSSVVTAEKSGYFKAYRSFGATSGANQVQIKLLKRNQTGTVSATAGGDVTLTNGSKVSLPAGGIVVASNNSAYTGTVKVFATYIDPTTQDIAQVIPGSLMADDKNGGRVTLRSFGMLAVELEGASGEKLQIKSGQNATLTTKIPAAALSTAPQTIAMWYVDETTGVWKEQGTATKQGDTYVGQVPHFSFWNCDQPMNGVTLSLTIKDGNGQPLVNVPVRITRSNSTALWWSYAYGWTDTLGQVSGMVPANEALEIDVLDRCWTSMYTQNVTALTANTVLPAITVSVASSQLTNVTGTLQNCSGSPVTNGMAIISVGNYVRYVSPDALGHFSASILSCGTPGAVQVLGIDNATQTQSANTTVTFTPGTTNAGTISVCGISAVQFINYTIDGTTSYSINSSNPGDSIMYYSYQQGSVQLQNAISGNANTGIAGLGFNFNTPTAAAGTYPLTNIYVNNGQTTMPTPISVNITNWPAMIGDFIQGNFSGGYKDASNVAHTISATFKLRKNN